MADWQELYTNCENCTACPLAAGRRNVVIGVGDRSADVMLIGEGPGEVEDRQGIPFVGPAGQLLDKLLCAVGIERDRLYIANAVKCHPPANRDPSKDEMEACSVHLRDQIELVSPKVIVCLGRIAAKRLISEDFRITVEHGRWFDRGGVYCTATFHPSALLRDPSRRADAFRDMRGVEDMMIKLGLKGLDR